MKEKSHIVSKKYVIYEKKKKISVNDKKYQKFRDHCHTLENIEELLMIFAI